MLSIYVLDKKSASIRGLFTFAIHFSVKRAGNRSAIYVPYLNVMKNSVNGSPTSRDLQNYFPSRHYFVSIIQFSYQCEHF